MVRVFGSSDIEAATDLQKQKNELDIIRAAILRYYIRWGFPAPRTGMERLKAALKELTR